MSELVLRGVHVRFGARDAVAGVDLRVPPGGAVGLIGESGSGKSTLARVAVGLVTPTAGDVTLDGAPVGTGRRRGPSPVQLVFQDPSSSLDPRMTVGEAVAEGLPPHLDRARRQPRVAELLDLVGLPDAAADRRPTELSGGQRQRVAVARALAAEPTVLIADEITSALDVSVQGALVNLVNALRRELGFSLLFISHDLAVVRLLCDEIAVMRDGQIVERAETDVLVASPGHPYTAALLAAVPTLPRHPRPTRREDDAHAAQ